MKKLFLSKHESKHELSGPVRFQTMLADPFEVQVYNYNMRRQKIKQKKF